MPKHGHSAKRVHYYRTLQTEAEGMKWVALNHNTNIDLLDVINDIDLVCVMSVVRLVDNRLSENLR
jgi:pentose-5-phosphate-3-epimerase